MTRRRRRTLPSRGNGDGFFCEVFFFGGGGGGEGEGREWRGPWNGDGPGYKTVLTNSQQKFAAAIKLSA